MGPLLTLGTSQIDGAQKRRRTRALITGGCGLAVVGLSVLISMYVSRRSDDASLNAGHSPASRQADGVIVIGGTGTRTPRVEIFETLTVNGVERAKTKRAVTAQHSDRVGNYWIR